MIVFEIFRFLNFKDPRTLSCIYELKPGNHFGSFCGAVAVAQPAWQATQPALQLPLLLCVLTVLSSIVWTPSKSTYSPSVC